MGLIRKVLGPDSQYDKTLPYTYMAKIDILAGEGDEPIFDHYFSSTICGLIEFLDEKMIDPNDVKLTGIYQEKEFPLENKYCMDANGKWLKKPLLCRSLETHFKDTMEECYKGHIEIGDCSFDDRDEDSGGPY